MNAATSSSRPEVLRRLYELMQRVNSVTDLAAVLDEVARGVVEVLGFGVAAISRLEGDTLVMTNVAAPEGSRQQILGLRTPVESVVNEFDLADEWGVLRFLPHGRVPVDLDDKGIWIPDLEPSDVPGSWHPMDTLYAPLWSATGQLLGNMAVDLPADGLVPSQEDRELLEMFVVQAGLAMDNAQQRERLGAQVRVGQMLSEVSSAGRLADLTLSLHDAGRAIGAGFDTDQVWIRCFTSGDLGRVEQSHAYPEGLRVDAALVRLAVDLARQAASSGRPVLLGREQLRDVPGLLREQDPPAPATDPDPTAVVMLAPVGSEREVLGYLVIARAPDEPRWSEEEQQAAMEVGSTLGRLVLDARLFERERHLVSELQELDRYKGELIATISHELKTPLSSIIGHTELLADLETDIGSVEAIARNARRLEGLVRNLLDYSALEESRTHVRGRVDLRTLAAASIDLVAVQVRRHDLTLSMTAPSDPVWVHADADELGTVVDNLVGNAVKYTRDGGVVTLEVGRDGESAYLTCTDTGLGISPADQVHLFSAFHRSSNPEALSLPGSGLGLAIARRIVALHAGQITVRSELGRGSTFRVDLPLGPEAQAGSPGPPGADGA